MLERDVMKGERVKFLYIITAGENLLILEKPKLWNSKEEVTIINRKYVWLENELSLLCKEGNKKTLNCCISRNCHLVKELINCCPNKVVQIHKPEANLDQVYVLNIFYDLLWNETLFLKKIIKMHIWMWGMSQRTLQ